MVKKEFTKEERHEIYELGYIVFLKKEIHGMCYCLLQAIIQLHPKLGKKLDCDITYLPMQKMLPEFIALKPELVDKNSHWWSTDVKGFEIRKSMFELIIEQTKS